MKIAVLGFAGEGQSSFEYWNRDDNVITICDRDASLVLPDGVNGQLGDDYLQNLDTFDLLIRTPALHPKDIVAANSPEILDKVWSNTNEFMKVCPSRNIVGVTGTKGKGTTSTLTAKLLEASGKKVHLAGNIGIPTLKLLVDGVQPDDWVVLELSSFQLIDLKTSPHIAVCLMVEAEHMDWHEDMEEYIAAKQQLFMNQTENDVAIYYSKNDNSEAIAGASEGELIPYMQKPSAEVIQNEVVIDGLKICDVSELKLLGKHNWQNVCAAVTAAWQVTQDIEAIRSVLTTFTGLEHRLEFVRELQGIQYYDDSFGTTPETAIVAIEAFEHPKVVILGGSTKGADFTALAKTVAENNVRQVILIGNTSHPVYQTDSLKIEASLKNAGFSAVTSLVKTGPTSMHDIIEAAKSVAQPGDIVLLSTGCASFDLFQNYKDRGEQFKTEVLKLV